MHPIDDAGQPPSGTHDVSFYCDDITTTVAEMRSRGVTFKHDPVDHGYGYVTYFEMPGGVEVQLYEPKYQKRAALAEPAATASAKPARKPAKAKPARKPKTARKPAAKPKSAAKARAKPSKRR